MTSQSVKLTARQMSAIKALLEKRTQEAAAVEVGVSPRTMYRWMQDPAFKAALVEAEGGLIDQATRQLLQLQDPAIKILFWAMASENHSAGVRLRAAQIALDYLIRLRELRNIEERLTALEKAVNNGRN